MGLSKSEILHRHHLLISVNAIKKNIFFFNFQTILNFFFQILLIITPPQLKIPLPGQKIIPLTDLENEILTFYSTKNRSRQLQNSHFLKFLAENKRATDSFQC